MRALAVLRAVDVVAAEDTRVTAKLLVHHGISRKLFALHEHNEQRAAQRVIDWLGQGKAVALVSDAGTPGVSDPGARAVAEVRAAGYRVVPIPGPSAALAALSAAGQSAAHVLFYGFLPAQTAARRRELEALSALPFLLAFYEAPHRIAATLAELAQVFGAQRNVTIARELTKLYEEIHVCPLGEAASWLAARPERERGEFVLLVERASAARATDHAEAQRVLEALLEELPASRAAALAARMTGMRRRDLYELALKLRGET